MKTNWKKLSTRIPPKIKIDKQSYDVLYSPHLFTNRGETHFDKPQILLEAGHTPKETVSTLFHELWHAVSHEYEIGLTENQVLKLEEFTPQLIKLIQEMSANKKTN